MAWYRCGGGGLPAGLQSDMDTVLNKKFSTSTTYPPTDWPDTVNLMGPLPEKTASSASVCSFSDGADDVPMKSVIAHIAPTLTGTNAVNMVQAGKNFYPIQIGEDSFSNNGSATHSDDNGTLVIVTSTGSASGVYINTSDNLCEVRNVLKWFNDNGYSKTISFDVVASVDSVSMRVTSGTNTLFTVGTTKTRVSHVSTSNNFSIYTVNTPATLRISNFQIEVGSTATAYEPYVAPTTYTANLGRTIYGGTADIVTGEGTDEYSAPITLDGTENWQKHGSIASWFYVDNLLVDAYANNSETGFIGSSWGAQKPYSQVSSLANGEFAYGAINRLVLKNTDFTEVADFKNWLSSNPITLVYKITTANTFTFDGQEIPSMLGVNNLWHDAGETECTYRADISLALQALGGGGRGLMMMRPTEPEETEETEETEGLENELNR